MTTPSGGIVSFPATTQQNNIVWNGVRDATFNVLFKNTDISNYVYLGYSPNISPNGTNAIPVEPNGSIILGSNLTVYAIWSVSDGVSPLVVIPGGVGTFLGLTQGLGNLAIPSIQSPDFESGIQGWQISQDGSVEFNNGIFRGSIVGGSLFLYTGTPGPGNPPILALSTASVDPYGNSIHPGDSVPSGSLILLGPTPAGGTASFVQLVAGTDLNLIFGTGDADETSPGSVIGEISGGGPGRTLDTAFESPTFASGVGSALNLASRSEDNSTQGAFWIIQAGSYALLSGERGSVGNGGMLYYEDTAGVWSIDRSMTDTTTKTNANNGGQDMTVGWTIEANDPVAGTVYQIEFDYDGTFENQTLTLEVSLDGTAYATAIIGSAFFSAGGGFSGSMRMRIFVKTAGASGTCEIWTDGSIGNVGTHSSGANANTAAMTARNTGEPFNTTVNHTFKAVAVWGGATAGQTISAYGSVFTRKGP